MTVLDLGSAAGNPLKMVRDKLAQMGGHGTLTGIELVPGWVEAGNAALGNTAHLFEGDVTDFTFELPEASYDLIMMNDSMEHIITSRYACLFERLNKYRLRRRKMIFVSRRGSRRRRGRDVDIPWGNESRRRRGRDADIPWSAAA